MRKPILLIVTNAMILVVAFVLLAQSLFVITRFASAQTARGDVKIQREGTTDWTPISTGDALTCGDVVKTGGAGEASFALADGTRWVLGPDSLLKMQRSRVDSLHRREENVLRLENGALAVRLVKSLGPESQFVLETPTLKATSRGGIWEVRLEKDATLVQCARGQVALQASMACNSPSRVVKAGQSVRLRGANWIENPAVSASSNLLQPHLLQPRLETEVVQNADVVVLRGQTEAGNRLFVDEKPVQVLGNGSFFQPLKIGTAMRQFQVTARDRFGAQASVCHRAKMSGEKLKLEGCE